jgi:hypothetical protein
VSGCIFAAELILTSEVTDGPFDTLVSRSPAFDAHQWNTGT